MPVPRTVDSMDAETHGAVKLLSALHEATRMFREFGYDQYLEHESVSWQLGDCVGVGVAPMAGVGVSFDLKDPDGTTVELGVSIWFRDGQFEIVPDASVDDPLPFKGGRENRRQLLDLPDVHTTDLDECISVLHDYATRLSTYTSVLDELGVPRGTRVPPANA